jgi:hypothetical protein
LPIQFGPAWRVFQKGCLKFSVKDDFFFSDGKWKRKR